MLLSIQTPVYAKSASLALLLSCLFEPALLRRFNFTLQGPEFLNRRVNLAKHSLNSFSAGIFSQTVKSTVRKIEAAQKRWFKQAA